MLCVQSSASVSGMPVSVSILNAPQRCIAGDAAAKKVKQRSSSGRSESLA